MKINYEIIEMMVFFWDQVKNREKIQDAYLVEIANKKELAMIYDEEFTRDSFRKVLSAISNKELLSSPTKAESRFWNLNMWMLEDMENMQSMLETVKKLNLDDIDSKRTLHFIPAHLKESYSNDDAIYINFFKIFIDPNSGSAQISGVPFENYVRGKAAEK